jgi:hypothetical protein
LNIDRLSLDLPGYWSGNNEDLARMIAERLTGAIAAPEDSKDELAGRITAEVLRQLQRVS